MLTNARSGTVRLLDAVVVLWFLGWLALAAACGWVVWQLSDIGNAIVGSGRALGSAGKAVRSLGDIPVVGDAPAQLGAGIVARAHDVVGQGQGLAAQVHQLSVLLGLLVLVVPTAPVLGLYLPARLARQRELAALRRTLASTGPDTATFDRYLAERALRVLPYSAIRSISPDPWRDLEAGHTRPLADALLRRFGLRRP